MPTSIRRYAGNASTTLTSRAKWIVESAHDTTSSLLSAFQTQRTGAGAPTHEQQDLLRAMLVFAGAGLDSSVKQAAEDCLPVLALHSGETREELEKFSVRRLRGLGEAESANRFLVKLLMQPSAEDAFIKEFVEDLTRGSLQSTSELHKMCEIFGIASSDMAKQIQTLAPVFEARNMIIHEMDMDFSVTNRNRRSRRREPMVAWTNNLLEVAERIVDDVDARIAELR